VFSAFRRSSGEARRRLQGHLSVRARAYSGLLGLPDVGLTTLTEVACAAAQITARVDLPLIVDVDTGFGEALNVSRTVAEMERANVAGIQIEDQVMPKRCGHLDGKQLADAEEMVKKIIGPGKRRRRGIVIVGRTDAASVEGIDSAIDRARQYLKARRQHDLPGSP